MGRMSWCGKNRPVYFLTTALLPRKKTKKPKAGKPTKQDRTWNNCGTEKDTKDLDYSDPKPEINGHGEPDSRNVTAEEVRSSCFIVIDSAHRPAVVTLFIRLVSDCLGESFAYHTRLVSARRL